MDWQQQVAVVTGASRGIGRAVVEAFIAKGARVAFSSRSAAALAEVESAAKWSGAEAVAFTCDVRDEASVAEFAAAVTERFGAPTIVVNNAGVGLFAPVATMATEAWDEVMATNVRGTFLVTRAFLPAMLETGRGDIVNVVSLSGRNGVAEGAAYAASKHAVLGFSRSLMLEVRKRGVRVIAVCPGSVDTAFFDGDTPFHPDRDRILKPEDVAQAIVAALELDPRAMLSELDLRPSNP